MQSWYSVVVSGSPKSERNVRAPRSHFHLRRSFAAVAPFFICSDALPDTNGGRQPLRGAAAHTGSVSIWQVGEQPSPTSSLPSSHSSPQFDCCTPSPQSVAPLTAAQVPLPSHS